MRKTVLIICTLLAALFIFTSTGHPYEWLTTYENLSGSNSGGESVVITQDGNFVYAGFTPGCVDCYRDFLVQKVDPAGQYLWARQYRINTDTDENAHNIITTSDGGFLVSGELWTGNNNEDIIILKLDHDGNIEWQKQIGGQTSEIAYAAVQLDDNSYIIAADYGNDMLLFRLDSTGNTVWARTYGGNGDDSVSSLIKTADHGLLLAGTTTSSGVGGVDGVLIKIDTDGTIRWQWNIGGTGNDYLLSIIEQQGANGVEYIVTGYSNSPPAQSYDMWVSRLGFDGNGMVTEWQKLLGGTRNDFAYSLTETSDGNITITGSTFSFGNENGDIPVIKLDATTGHVIWQKNYALPPYSAAKAIIPAGDGMVLAGRTDESSRAILMKLDASGTIPGCPNGNDLMMTVQDAGFVLQPASLVSSTVNVPSGDASFTAFSSILLSDYECFHRAPTGEPTRDFTVNSSSDTPDASPGDGLCLTTEGTCTLRAAIQEANRWMMCSQISFDPDILPADISIQGDLDPITSCLNIQGPGSEDLTIIGNGHSLFEIYDDAFHNYFSLSGISITGGRKNGNAQIQTVCNDLFSGGGICINGDVDVTLDSCIIYGNSADRYGGGIALLGGNLTATNCSIYGNRAVAGGGVAALSYTFFQQPIPVTFSVNSTSISDNSATEGGGLYIEEANATIRNSLISRNQTFDSQQDDANASAMAIHNPQGFSVSVINSTISSNTGGPLAILAEGDGAGNNGPVHFESSTIAFNRGGIAGDGDATLHNTILAGNSIDTLADCNATDGLTVTSLGYNIVGADACGITPAAGDIIGDTASPVDPGLDPNLQDNGGATATHALLASSPALNTGDPDVYEPADQRGFYRPYGPAPDIGALESRLEADLGVSLANVPATIETGETFSLVIDVENSGPDNATGVILQYWPPADATAFTIQGQDWNCDTSQTPAACQLDTMLETGSISELHLSITAPDHETDMEHQARVQSDLPDYTPGNDSLTGSLHVNWRYYDITAETVGLGHGTVISTPQGIDTGAGVNSYSFREQTEVTLTATAGPDSAFAGWEGACQGENPECSLSVVDVPLSCSAEFRLLEPGEIGVESTDYPVAENAGPVRITISRTGGTDGQVTAWYTTRDGSAVSGRDYVASNGTITWEAGDDSPRTVTIDILDDDRFEDPRSFTLEITRVSGSTPVEPSLGQNAAATITIVDNDPPRHGYIEIEQATCNRNEGDGSISVTILRTQGSDGQVSVNYATRNGSARAQYDYRAASGTITWADGSDGARTVSIQLYDDSLHEEDETFYLDISDPTGGANLGSTASARLTIVDNDPLPPPPAPLPEDTVEEKTPEADLGVSINCGEDSARPGETVQCIVTVTNSGPDIGQSVVLSYHAEPSLENMEVSSDGGSTWQPATGRIEPGDMLPGSSARIFLKGAVPEAEEGTITVSASASSATDDTDSTNNSSSTVITLNLERLADLAISATPEGTQVKAGDTMLVRIGVYNQGPDMAENVSLSLVTNGIENPEFSIDNGESWTRWTGSLPGGINLPEGFATQAVLLRGTAAATGPDTAAVTASIAAETPDPDTSNNQAAATATIIRPAIRIVESRAPEQAYPDEEISLVLTWTNDSGAPAQGVKCTIQLDENLEFVSSSVPPDQEGVPAWTVGTMEPGETLSINIIVRVKAAETGPETTDSIFTITSDTGVMATVHQEIAITSNPVPVLSITPVENQGGGVTPGTSQPATGATAPGSPAPAGSARAIPAQPVPEGLDVPELSTETPPDGYADETLEGATAGADGELYLIGTAFNGRAYQMHLLKYGPDGKLEWHRVQYSGIMEYGYGITTGPDHALYTAGYRLVGNTYRAVLSKFNQQGFRIWSRELSTGGMADTFYAVTVSGGKIYAAGESYNGHDFDLLLAQYDSNGNLIWKSTLNKPGNNTGYAVAVWNGIPVMVGGDGAGTAGTGWLTLFDPATGGVTRQIALAPGTVLSAMAPYDRDSLYVAGTTAGGDWSIFRLDKNLNVVWNRTFDSGGYDGLRDITVDRFGNVYATGRSSGAGGYDILVAAFDPSGRPASTLRLDEGLDERGHGLVFDSTGRLFVAGQETGSDLDSSFLLFRVYNGR